MSDLIERDKAIKAMAEYIGCDFARHEDALECARSVMEQIPSARPKGKWIERIGGISKELFYQCSKCYGEVDTDEFDYCPWCSADMRERKGER